MHHRIRALPATLVATLVLAAAAGTADANRIEISSQGIRAVWREVRMNIGGFEINCPVTIEGSFHSQTISKVREALVGLITRAMGQHPCSGAGQVYILNGIEMLEITATTNTLPWHIRYDSFSGTLPNIRTVSLKFIGVSPLAVITEVGLRCLYLSTIESPLAAITTIEAGRIASVRFERATIPIKAGQSPLCASPATVTGSGSLTQLGSETRVTIQLVS